MSFKLRNVSNSHSVATLQAKAKITQGKTPLDVSGVTATGSQMGSQQTRQSRGNALVTSQSPATSASATPLSPAKKKGFKKETDTPKPRISKLIFEEDLATILTCVVEALPKEHKVGDVLDFDNANRIYQNFSAECQEEFVFKSGRATKEDSCGGDKVQERTDRLDYPCIWRNGAWRR